MKKRDLPTGGTLVGPPCFAPDSSNIACATEVVDPTDKKAHLEIMVWDVEIGKETLSCASPPVALAGVKLPAGEWSGWVRFDHDGQRLLTFRSGDSLRAFDARTGKQLLAIAVKNGSAVLSPDGNWSLTRNDNTLFATDVATGKSVAFEPVKDAGKRRFQGVPTTEAFGQLESTPFSPDGKYFVDRNRVWEVETGKELFSLVKGVHNEPPIASFSADGRYVIAAEGLGHIDWSPILEKGPTAEQIEAYKEDDPAPRWTIWDLATRKEVRSIRQPADAITSMDFSPDGKQVVTGIMATSAAGAVCLWDTGTGKRVHRFDASMPPVTCVNWSPDDKLVAAACEDLFRGAEKTGELRIWEAASHREVLALKGLDSALCHICFSPDGKRILGAGRDHVVRLWEIETGNLVAQLKGHKDSVTSIAFGPGGEHIITAGADMTVRLWDPRSGRLERSLKGHVRTRFGNDPRLSAVFTPDGKRVLSGGDDGPVKVWDVATGQEIATFQPQSSAQGSNMIRGLSFDTTGRALLVQYEQWGSGRVDHWDGSKSSDHYAIDSHHQGLVNIAFSPDSKHFASSGRDQTVAIRDIRTGQEVMVLEGHYGETVQLSYSPDGKRLLALTIVKEKQEPGADGSEIKIWDTENGNEILSLAVTDGFLMRVAFSPDGKRLAGGSLKIRIDGKDPRKIEFLDGKLRVWDASTGAEVWSAPTDPGFVSEAAYSPDGSRIIGSAIRIGTAGAPERGELRIWEARTGKELMAQQVGQGAYLPPRFSPDGRLFVCGAMVFDMTDPTKPQFLPGRLQIFETESGKPIREFEGRKGSITSIGFSPNGKQIICTEIWSAVTDMHGIVNIFDAITGKTVRSFGAGTGRSVSMLAGFSPDGKWLVTARADGQQIMWNAKTGEEVLRFVMQETMAVGMLGLGLGTPSYFSPDGKWLVCPGDGDTINVWPLEALERRLRGR